MKNREILLIANLLFSIGGIVGNSLWAASNSIYTLSSAYEFYWFVTVSSFLIGVGGSVYYSGVVKYSENVKQYLSYAFVVVSVLYPIFWLAASASVASHLRDCLYIKNKLREYDDDFYFWGYRFNVQCDGEIVSTSFGFANFIVWVYVLFLFYPYIKRKFFSVQESSSNANVEMQQTNASTEDAEEVVNVEMQGTNASEATVVNASTEDAEEVVNVEMQETNASEATVVNASTEEDVVNIEMQETNSQN
jgi:hypothetical protein